MIVGTLNKQPREIRRATIDYGSRFLKAGDTITAVQLIPSSDDLTVARSSSLPDTVLTMIISGGVSGEQYMITARVDVSDGQRIESEIVVICEEIDQ